MSLPDFSVSLPDFSVKWSDFGFKNELDKKINTGYVRGSVRISVRCSATIKKSDA